MPLSPPESPRELLHTRRIELHGYHRADGLFDVEAQLTDTKSHTFLVGDRGELAPGDPLHGMTMRMTVDADMTVVRFEAATDASPYRICPDIAPNFASLAGLSIRPGFLRAAAERVGGVHGCTHLRELLQQMATVAFQTLYPVRAARAAQAAEPTRPALLNTCYAYGEESPVVARTWPAFYTGPNPSPAEATPIR